MFSVNVKRFMFGDPDPVGSTLGTALPHVTVPLPLAPPSAPTPPPPSPHTPTYPSLPKASARLLAAASLQTARLLTAVGLQTLTDAALHWQPTLLTTRNGSWSGRRI